MKKLAVIFLVITIFVPFAISYAGTAKCPHGGKWDGTKCILVGNCPLNTEWNGVRCVLKGSKPTNKKSFKQPAITNELIAEIEREGEALANRINAEDGISSSEAEDIINVIFTFLAKLFAQSKDRVIDDAKGQVGNIKDNIVEKIPFVGKKEPKWGTDIDGDGITDFDPNEVNPFEDTGLSAVKPGQYRTEKWPNEDGTKIAKIVDVYGKERYTSDGKHFYDTPYDAAHSSEGLSNMWNGAKDTWGKFWNTKNSDKDKQLRMDVAREVLEDAKTQSEKDVDNAYNAYQAADFAHDAVSVAQGTGSPAMFFAGVPADAVVAVAKEVSANDFSSAAAVYIRERERGENNSPMEIRKTMPELFGEGYGTLGNEGAISLKTKNEHAPAVLLARYEEAYQRYKIAKEFGRE